jgi:lipopolysaccharide/colanic/teichoic acid biosynthesis glycosyltransferase
VIYLILKFEKVNPFVVDDKIGAGYDLLHLYHFNTESKFGKFLKKFNIYRWPEIFNVLLGHISVIGNKALPLEEAKMYTSDKHSLRFLAPTGLTGVRHIYDVKEKKSIQTACQMENEYAMQRSIWTDFIIFIKSLPFLFRNSQHQYYDL